MDNTDYRYSLRPSGPYLALLSPYRRRVVELLVRGYTRGEIAGMMGRKKHATDVVIKNSMNDLGVTSDIELVLLAYGLIDGRELLLQLPKTE